MMPDLEVITTPVLMNQDIAAIPEKKLGIATDTADGNEDEKNSDFLVTWAAVFNSLTKLKFLDIEDYRQDSCLPFRSQSVTTVTYQYHYPDNQVPFQIKTIKDVPNLRQFRFNSVKLPLLISLLKVIGDNLVTLIVSVCLPTLQHMPEKLWSLCPRLEYLGWCGLLKSLPPLGLPLHTISVSFPCIPPLETNYLIPFNRGFLKKLGKRGEISLRHVIVQDLWDKLEHLMTGYPSSPLYVLHWFLDCFSVCEQFGISFEDINGVPFKDTEWNTRLEIFLLITRP